MRRHLATYASYVVILLYILDLIDEYEGKKHTMLTARIFTTYLHEGVSKSTGFGDQVDSLITKT